MSGRWRFEEAKDELEFRRATRFCGSFYDESGARLGVVGDADAKRFVVMLNGADDPRLARAERVLQDIAPLITKIQLLTAHEPHVCEDIADEVAALLVRYREPRREGQA